ncbi:LCP family protein [Lentzea sp. BCCO 10_0856]|uniref:LCP family protein n=1 Tax=Lentzea miocenica TaxID=3095431 RepID=A0ABU4T8Z9_9PSEU|nr:LCP family protein [Lentzea sp. BCCO 10_0856]MDX8034649.1 LCP family protein [Lentzea sp. BCCO 10_0856]
MEGSGGLSVSDLIEQHSRTNIPRPVPPGSPDASTTGRRALPDPPATGRRALPDPPAPQQPPQAQPQQPRQQPPVAHRPGEQTGTRPRPPMADQAPPQNFTGDQTGRRRRPDAPAEQTGSRPRPAQGPAQNPAQTGSYQVPGEQTGPRPRPDATGMQRHPAPGDPNSAVRRPEADATGTRRRPAPGEMGPNGTPRRPAQGDVPSSNGIPRPPAPDANGMQRPPVADAPTRRPAEPPSSNGIPRPPAPDNGVARPPGDVTSNGMPRPPAPGDPRRMPPGDAPSSNGIPRRQAPGVPEANGLPSGTIRRPAPDANGAPPRRLAPGDAPSSNGIPRPPAPDAGMPRPPAPGDMTSNGMPRPPAPGDAKANGMPRPPAPDTPGNGMPRPPGDVTHNGIPRPPAPGGTPEPGAPRRLLAGEAPSPTSVPRPPAPGEGPDRRPMPPNGDMTGRQPMPSRAESSGPRPMPRPPAGAAGGGAGGGAAIANRLGATPDAPAEEPKADAPGPEATQIASAAGVAKVEKREDMDPMCLTTEMEAIGDDVKKRREVDHTLARFSAVHDELLEQERQRKERRAKLMPWVKDDEDENEEATQFADPVVLSEEGTEQKVTGRTPQQRKLMRGAKIGAIAAAAVVFASTGIGWTAVQWADSKIPKIDALGGNSQAVQQAEKQLGDENFLLVGSDTRAGAKAGDNVGTQAQEGGARSDVIMLAHIPADRKRMVVVSLPRDVRVDRPECRSWNPDNGQYAGPLKPEKEVMANSVYNDGGPECVANLMTQLTGLKINHFVSIDFVGFREMSTAIGGVQICSPTAIVDDELGVILEKPGKYTLKGDQALQYVRARKVQAKGDSGTDFDRIKRQQGFLSAMLRQALSNEVLLSPTKLNNFISALTKSTVGDNIDVASLLELANSLQSLDAGRVSFVTMPHWTDDNKLKDIPDDNIERLKDDDVKALFQTIIDGTPLPQEKPVEPKPGEQANTPAQPGTVIDPKDVTIQVLNGDPTNGGLVARTSNALEQQGFKVARRDNAPENAPKTVIRYSKGNENKAATLKAAVPSAELVESPDMGGAVVLTLGANFDEKVVSPKAGGTAQGNNQGQPGTDLSIVNAAQDPCAK